MLSIHSYRLQDRSVPVHQCQSTGVSGLTDSPLRLLHSINYRIPKVLSVTCSHICTFKTYFPLRMMIAMMISSGTLIFCNRYHQCCIFSLRPPYLSYNLHREINTVNALLCNFSVLMRNVPSLLKSFDTVEDEHAKNMGRWWLSEVKLFCDGIRRYVRMHLSVYLLGSK